MGEVAQRTGPKGVDMDMRREAHEGNPSPCHNTMQLTSSGTRMYLMMLPRTKASGMRQNLSPSWSRQHSRSHTAPCAHCTSLLISTQSAGEGQEADHECALLPMILATVNHAKWSSTFPYHCMPLSSFEEGQGEHGVTTAG
eukprot:1161690-Pelagomonas_calceolata.AAC.4